MFNRYYAINGRGANFDSIEEDALSSRGERFHLIR